MRARDAYAFFGIKSEMTGPEAEEMRKSLAALWRNQIEALPASHRKAARLRLDDLSADALESDLDLMKHWFDPIASGKRLREVLSSIPIAPTFEGSLPAPAILIVDSERSLLTPEGRVLLWAIESSTLGQTYSDVYIAAGTAQMGLTALSSLYREWSRQRIDGVAGLLNGETATLRPTAAGLLLVLLLNRNTSPERRLPAPESPLASDEMSTAIAAPAIAFARELAGSERASERGIDLYRGWGMGEISRRLGSGLHRAADGVWITPEAEPAARRRLIEAMADRPPNVRLRLGKAIDAALAEYERVRPALSGLGLAHERPSNTRKLKTDLLAAIDDLE